MERYPINPLFGQLHRIQADVADLVAMFLHRDVKPILLLHGVALALVVACGVSLLRLLCGSVVERLADDDSARSSSSRGERVAVGKLVTKVCAACAEGDVANGASGGATGKQAGDQDEREEFGGVDDVFRFHDG